MTDAAQEKTDLLSLQNGSDVRGVAMQTPGGPSVNLTPAAVRRIAAQFTGWLADRTGKKAGELRIGVGHDSRLTAQALKQAAGQGFAGCGAAVFDCALASTPAMFMGCVFEETNFDGAVMITASHLPQNRNGMKFFTKDGGAEKRDITDILTRQAKTPPAENFSMRPCGLMRLYAAALREKIVLRLGAGEKPLAGLHVAVDAGNGAGGFFVRQVLQPLGANCAGSQFLEPDGSFPNHQPNPENAEAMRAVCRAVKESGADLGIIFDTDVDRMSAVLKGGVPVNRNAIIALMAAVIAPDAPGGTVVTDSVTSDFLTEFIEKKLGMRHRRFMRGYRNVINEAVRLNAEGADAPLAIETSGHAALRENYFLDDGAYMAVRIIAAAAAAAKKGRGLQDLLCGYREPLAEAERRITVEGPDFAAYGRAALAAFEERGRAKGLLAAESFEGVRFTFPGEGWVMLRLSLHDPVLPLNAEGRTPQDLRRYIALVKELLCGFERLDLSPLE